MRFSGGLVEIKLKFKNCFVVSSCSCSTFIFYVFVNSGVGFCLILGSFLTFWSTYGLFLGWGRVGQLFWGLLI